MSCKDVEKWYNKMYALIHEVERDVETHHMKGGELRYLYNQCCLLNRRLDQLAVNAGRLADERYGDGT